MWSSQNRNSEWLQYIDDINWHSTWLYINNNSKQSNIFTNLKSNTIKSFRIKLLLNELLTLSHLHLHYSTLITTKQCNFCNSNDSSTHWLYCPNISTLPNIINTTIPLLLQKYLPDLSISDTHFLTSQLLNTLTSSNTFNNSSLPSNLIIRGLVPNSLIQLLIPYTQSKSLASQLLISLLLSINQNIFDQLWKPYCSQIQQWKLQNNIRIPHSSSKPKTKPRTIKSRQKQKYTYNCTCEQPDQLHSPNNSCPPIGTAIRKIDIWSTMWIKYSTSTNYILSIKI
jgi:hypothetical protein